MSGYEIEIIDQQKLLKIEESTLEAVVERVLREHQIGSAQIHVLLVDNPTIHGINMAHLQHDYPTDVITFPMNEPDEVPPEYPLEGEIVISTEMACELAESLEWSPLEETKLYLIHGLLHLCGYDDLTESALQDMRLRELEMLKLLQIPVSAADQRWADCRPAE